MWQGLYDSKISLKQKSDNSFCLFETYLLLLLFDTEDNIAKVPKEIYKRWQIF